MTRIKDFNRWNYLDQSAIEPPGNRTAQIWTYAHAKAGKYFTDSTENNLKVLYAEKRFYADAAASHNPSKLFSLSDDFVRYFSASHSLNSILKFYNIFAMSFIKQVCHHKKLHFHGVHQNLYFDQPRFLPSKI